MNPSDLALRRAARTWVIAALIIAFVVLSACGGGGDSGTSASPAISSQPSQPASLTAGQLDAAQKLYAGTPRTPADFITDPLPAGATGAVSTAHLKNSDVGVAGSTRYELCSNDMAQVTAWSESKTATLPVYADLVDQSSSVRALEVIRVPRNDVTARLRQRVFRCDYLDRTGTDLTADTGPAGTVTRRPLDAAVLKDLSEYLWEFTAYNNADYVVLSSTAATAATGQLAHAIDMAHLTRGVNDCDRVDLLRWTHTLDIGSGALQRRLETLGTYSARRSNGVVSSCTP